MNSQFTYLCCPDSNNRRGATLRRRINQNKTNRQLFSTEPQRGQDPPRSHSSGLDSVLVSSLTFRLPYDFTINYTLRDQPLPSLRANTKSATPLQRPYIQDEVSNAVRRKPRTDEKYTTFHTRIHHLPRMGLNHRYLDQRRRHRWTHRLVLGSGEFSVPEFLI